MQYRRQAGLSGCAFVLSCALVSVAAAQPTPRDEERAPQHERREVPESEPEPAPVVEAKPDLPPAPPAPGTRSRSGAWLELNAGIGMAFGGDELPDRTQGLAAGDGIVLTLGAAATPLWHDWLGIGAGLDFGFKYYALQAGVQGGVDLRRVPLVGSVHALLAVDARWFVLVAGGPYLELAIQASRTGSASGGSATQYPSALGFMAEAGVLYAFGHIGADITLRYTGLGIDDAYGDSDDADASSLGLFLGIHVLL